MASKKSDKDLEKKTKEAEKLADVEDSEEREAAEEPEVIEEPEVREEPEVEEASAVLEEDVVAGPAEEPESELDTEPAIEPETKSEIEPEIEPESELDTEPETEPDIELVAEEEDVPGGDPSSTLSFEPEVLPLDEMRAMDSLDRDPFEPSDMRAFSGGLMGSTTPLPVIQGNSSFRPPQRHRENNTATIVVSIVSVIAVIAVAIAAIVTVVGQSSPAPVDTPPPSSMQGDIRDIINGTNKREPGLVIEDPAAEAPQSEPEPESEAPAEAEEPEETIKDRSEWILPESDLRYYTDAELSLLTDEELYLARNEIYARLGREFKNADLRDYFSSKSWYTPKYAPEDFDRVGPTLNSYERANADAIMALESERGIG